MPTANVNNRRENTPFDKPLFSLNIQRTEIYIMLKLTNTAVALQSTSYIINTSIYLININYNLTYGK